MNQRIKSGWNYFWNLKPSQSEKMKNALLVTQLHTWMSLVVEEFKTGGEVPKEKDLEELVKEIFK